MHCPNPDCETHGIVYRREAVLAILDKLQRMLTDDAALTSLVSDAVGEIGEQDDQEVKRSVTALDRRIGRVTAQISGLQDMLGEGSETDRAETRTKIRTARAERASLERERAELSQQLNTAAEPLTPEGVRRHLSELTTLLREGAAGELGDERVHEAAEAFRLLVGGCVGVYVETRGGRKQTNVRGVFLPHLLQAAVGDRLDATVGDGDAQATTPISLWLRPPPRIDRLAPLVAYFYGVPKLGYRRITKVLQEAGVDIGCGNVYVVRKRYYQILGLDVPKSRTRGRSCQTT